LPDVESIAIARKKVGAAFTALLKDISDRQICQAGSKKTREQLPAISADTGGWRDDGVDSKPLVWLIHFGYDRDANTWKAFLPAIPHARRLYGGFNTKSPLQGLLCRIIPVMRVEAGIGGANPHYEPHPYWEWALAFVFPDLAVFTEGGSSGATIDFDPTSGRLESTIGGQAVEQPYVSAGLFALNAPDDVWSVGDLVLTYGEATELLAAMVNVQPTLPSPSNEPDEEN
jgi:hypothetical protein